MSGDGNETPPVPDEPQTSRIGADEWVATHAGRTQLGRFARELQRLPPLGFYLGFGVVAALLPALTSNGYIVRVGFDTLIYMLLALGLNVAVGYAGLLDLGYVAFFGFAAYGYAMLASPKFGLHWSALAVVPLVVVATAILGLLVALPSRRLVGDYLAIVTLFFGQLFVAVYTNGERISFLGFTRPYDLTGGPNGIVNVDPWHLFGQSIQSLQGYYYLALIVFMIALIAMYLVDRSRTGRAWRSLREDSLAAELMGIPVNRLKLVAFVVGAAVAGIAGTVFVALNTATFATDFDVPTLIVVYSMLILGGAGSLGGVIIGALVVNISLEVLRTPDHATWVFYTLLAFGLVLRMRPWQRLAAVIGGTIAFGFVVHAIVSAISSSAVAGQAVVGGFLGSGLGSWVVLPSDPKQIGNMMFVVLILAVLGLTLLHGWQRDLALVPTLYLAAFVWENRLVVEPSITRLILIGVILIVLMNARPQGLLGTAKVEIV